MKMLKIRSKIILKSILQNTQQKKYMQLLKYNKILQKKLNISIIDYKEYNQIEVELRVNKMRESFSRFINLNEKDKPHIHIFISNNKKKEYNRFFLKPGKKIVKLRILIDLEIKSFKGLFKYCDCIKEIKFIKFNRKDIIDMSDMFYGCKNLIKLDFSNFNTDKVTDMSFMFYDCSSLKELNLNKFNTTNVVKMESTFHGCSSLKKLNISTFQTNKVINMCSMFHECILLKELNLSNFKTGEVKNMSNMFYECKEIKSLNISSFDTSKVVNMSYMFNGCSKLIDLDISNFEINKENKYNYMFSFCQKKLKEKIKLQNKNLKNDAFKDDKKHDLFSESCFELDFDFYENLNDVQPINPLELFFLPHEENYDDNGNN